MTKSRLALVVASLALASCATLEREEVAAPANGGNVVMRVGTPVVVSLPPDPDTGYGWVLRTATPNLQLVGGPDYTPQPRPPGLVGVADTTSYRFRAVSEGKGSMEFVWSVPPGAAPQPDKVVRYDVDIGPRLWLLTDVFGTVGLPSARTADASSAAASPVK
ncbi:MAG: protease inhibitor I42 family protein [Burkholderiales bacterium]